MIIDLKGKRALVCGSTQGIGHGCALQIARSGASVTLAARNEASLASVSSQLPREHGQDHHFVCADFDDPAALQCAVQAAVDEKGGFDILDVGCGFGEHMAVFEAAGNRVVGICGGDEYYVEHFRFVHELLGLEVRYTDITQPWDFPDESFDFVFSAQTITLPSLILKAADIIKTMLRVCRSPGRVVVVPHPHLKWDK